jgi:hypothetical protein
MAASGVSDERSSDIQRRTNRRRGYTPGSAGGSGSFASGFNSFLATGSFSLALRLGVRYGVDREFLTRYLGVLTANALFSPLRLWQSLGYDRRIRRTELHPEPMFLLGFWRSGTTLLHNLLAIDERWGYVNTYQAAMPDLFLAGQRRIRRMLESQLPENRGVDNIPVDFAMPQEEEIAMMCTSGVSPYVSLNFPRTASSALNYLFLDDRVSATNRDRWRKKYLHLLKAASYNMGGKPLLLKSPSNTSRISALLDLFPAARFVYIQRNPYDTLRSYVHLLTLMNDWHALQRMDFDELLLRQVKIYREMALTYLEQKELIPPGRLIEIRYESLEEDNIGQIREIYTALDLDGYREFEPDLREYVASIADFQKNPSHISDQVIDLVNEHVPFLVSEYGYEGMSPTHSSGASARGTI